MATRERSPSLAIIVFAFLSLVPLASISGRWLWPWPHPDSMPQVTPVEFPNRMSAAVLNKFQQWFVDRVRRNLPLLAVNTAYQVGLLGRSPNPAIAVIGREGWLFYTDEGDQPGTMANFRGKLRFTDAEVQKLNEQFVGMHRTLSACGIAALIAVAPNKQSIYGEYLGDSGELAKTELDDVLPRLVPEARAMVLDLRQPLRSAKAQNPHLPLYYKTDTHWNTLGAYYAYRAIINTMATRQAVADLPPASLDQFTIDVQPFRSGDISGRMLSAPSWFADTDVQLRRKIVSVAPPDSGRLMIIGDSFSGFLRPYLELHFSDVQFRNFVDIASAPGHGKPSFILLEVVERYLPHLVTLNFDWTRFCAP